MKRVKRERKVKRARRKSGQKKRNLHVKKVTNKSGRKIFIKKEIPEQVQVKEKPKTTEKKNLWIYVLVLIIIIILILLMVKFIPVLKTPENPPKPSSIIPLPTAAVTQQVIQEKIVSEKTESPAQEKETKIIIYFPLNEWDVKNLSAGEKDKLNALIDNFLKDKTQQGLFIYGYADRTGLRSYNVSVSEKRAQNIAEFLSSKTGIEMNKIVVEGKGEILKGPDGVNNPLFRKVEIIIISGTP